VRRWIVAMVLIVAIIAGVWAWDYTRVKVAYFEQIGERWGVPEGLLPLDDKAIHHRDTSYRVERSRGKVRRISRVNAASQLRDNKETHDASKYDIGYRANGSIETIDWRDHNGRIVLRELFDERDPRTPEQFVEFRQSSQGGPSGLQANVGNIDFSQ